ncbi:hypothetical protein BGZ61DRAFT_471456 [Ilyonectria robusta]|uniref:uncharacterized protein n=1 Tax=Ilyonectria robusta TaxID=1079257 RepID=UPI001E8E9CC1|nr:uncharacterized protein BGZ61DRAFT_471456 [Ilyonectria robusta]KAH8738100.1 hypothetical protein BGZ61DRAFT_471456 [Ilyonectria robusta]
MAWMGGQPAQGRDPLLRVHQRPGIWISGLLGFFFRGRAGSGIPHSAIFSYSRTAPYSSASSVRILRLTDCRMMIALNCRDDKIHQFARSPAPYRYRSRAEPSPSAAKPIPGAMARAALASVTRTVA